MRIGRCERAQRGPFIRIAPESLNTSGKDFAGDYEDSLVLLPFAWSREKKSVWVRGAGCEWGRGGYGSLI